MIEEVKIPEQRKGVLIGTEGVVKREIEKKTRTVLTINDGIEIEGETLDVLKTKEIIKAIGRGFAPEKALKLLGEDYRLAVISLGQEKENMMKRILARIIGSGGKCRRTIEMMTKTDISVYGKTISIIGKWGDVERASGAIEMIIAGKTHAYVYKCIEEGSKGEEAGEDE
jgi:ribosomal RNA assembly protein